MPQRKRSARIKPKKYAVGIDFGGSFLKIGLVEHGTGNVVGLRHVEIKDRGARNIPDLIEREIQHTIERHGEGKDIVGVGMAVPSAVKGNRVLNATAYPGLANIDIAGRLSKRLGYPVRLINDASAALRGELRFGAGRSLPEHQKKNSMMVTLGTFMGGRALINGEEYAPPNPERTEMFWGNLFVPTIAAKNIRPIVSAKNTRRSWSGDEGVAKGMAAVGRFASTPSLKKLGRQYIEMYPESKLAEFASREELTPELIDRAAREGDRGARSLLRTAGAAAGFAAVNRAEEFGTQVLFINRGMFRSDHLRGAFIDALRQKDAWLTRQREEFLGVVNRARQEGKSSGLRGSALRKYVRSRITELGGDKYRTHTRIQGRAVPRTPIPVFQSELGEPGVHGAAAHLFDYLEAIKRRK